MFKIAIFASGSGTNAENIARHFHDTTAGVRVVLALVNRKEAGVYQRMEKLGIPARHVPDSVWKENPAQVVEMLRQEGINMVVLAGFLRPVAPSIIKAVDGCMLNIHPSLLPKYGGKGMYGHKVHEAVMAAGDTKAGATVHMVTEEIDGGQIVQQGVVDILPGDTIEDVEAKVHEQEYLIFPQAISKIIETKDPAALGQKKN